MVPTKMFSPANAAKRVIIALDVDNTSSASDIVDQCGVFGVGFKVGLQLFTNAGPSFVAKLAESGHRVFLDLKYHDIPNTVAKAAVEAARLGVWMCNVHALGGSEMMKRAVAEVTEAAEREGIDKPKMLAVTVLTSSDQTVLSELGIQSSVDDQVLRLAILAKESGMDGVVASAREASVIRRNLGGDFLLVTPGIRPANATNYDQKRVTTPVDALAAGADYLVIGRPITDAADRTAELNKILKEIENSGQ